MRYLKPAGVTSIWLVVALYFGMGGYVKVGNLAKYPSAPTDTMAVNYKGIDFKNKAEMKAYMADKDSEDLFPWILLVPPSLGLIITACSFGVLGSITSIVLKIAVGKSTLAEARYVSLPLLGLLTGVIVTSISVVLPSAILSGEGEPRPASVMLISLLGGLFSEKFYDYLSSLFDKILEKN